jgi:DNA-binding MarR family transcriptional regulator
VNPPNELANSTNGHTGKSGFADSGSPKALPEQCAAELMEAIPPVMQFIRTEMRSQNAPVLSVPQFRALNYLRRHPDASLSEVAEHVGITRASASTLIERLVQRSFVTRADDPNERRHVMLNLTEMGSNHLQQARTATLHKIAILLEMLSPEELNQLCTSLATLKDLFTTAIAEPDGTHPSN